MLEYAVLLLSLFALTHAQVTYSYDYKPIKPILYPGNIELTPQGYVTYNPHEFYSHQNHQNHQSQQPIGYEAYPQYQSQYQPQYQPQYQQPYFEHRISQPDIPPSQTTRAICKIEGENVKGNITFTQSEPHGPVLVEGILLGLPAGEKGFHVHEKGDITGGCLSTGPHFNPYHMTHGAAEDAVRHVGDLGNIVFNEQKVAVINKVDSVISLNGPNSIIGRAIVVHTGTDDLGRTDHKDSKTTGNAGGRAGCGVIGIL